VDGRRPTIDDDTHDAASPDRRYSDDGARGFAGEARTIVAAAIERLHDYQDHAYVRDFLARLERFQEIERKHGDGSGRLLEETARQLALAMTYEDTIRVADLKIRASRFARVREEAQVADGQILEIAEFFHPRTQEIADTLPAGAGRWLMRTGWARRLLDRATRKGKVIKTTSVGGFLLLYALSQLKPLRRARCPGRGTGCAHGLARSRGGDRARRLCARAAGRAHAQPGQGLRRHA
jgi:hypothetical protein